MTHICIGNQTIIDSDNGLSPDRRQAIIWNNVGILLSGPLGIVFSQISIEIHTFSFKKMHLKTSSAKWVPSCLGLNVLTWTYRTALATKLMRSSVQRKWLIIYANIHTRLLIKIASYGWHISTKERAIRITIFINTKLIWYRMVP